jgi:hypothetical protein
MKGWRRSLAKRQGEFGRRASTGGYPSASQLAERMGGGVTQYNVYGWENKGIENTTLSCVLRAHFGEGLTFEKQEVEPDRIRQLAVAVGSAKALAEMIGVSAIGLRNWYGGFKPMSWHVRVLFRWLCDEMGLEARTHHLRGVSNRMFGESEVHQIRRRYADGEQACDLADEFDCAPASIGQIVRRESYKEVG